MKNTLLILFTMMSTSAALAVQLSYTDTYNSEKQTGTIVQDYSTGDYLPGGAYVNMLFAQFDDLDGTRTLQSVTVSVSQSSWGGYYAVDNDGDEIANITVTHGTSGRLSTSSGSYYFLPPGADDALSTTLSSGGSVQLAANDGDAVGQFNAGDADYYRLDGPEQTAALTDTKSGSWDDDKMSAYVGNGDLGMDYVLSQTSVHAGKGELYYSGGPASANAEFTVIYDYAGVPEPTSLALLLIGCIALGLRRRKS